MLRPITGPTAINASAQAHHRPYGNKCQCSGPTAMNASAQVPRQWMPVLRPNGNECQCSGPTAMNASAQVPRQWMPVLRSHGNECQGLRPNGNECQCTGPFRILDNGYYVHLNIAGRLNIATYCLQGLDL